MSRAAKIILLVLVAILVIATVLLLALRLPRGEKAAPAVNAPAPGAALPGAPAANLPPRAPAVPAAAPAPSPAFQASEAERTRAEILRTSTQFAERFGSYSSQSNFENVEDLRPLMTDTMQAWADRYLAAARAAPPSPTYIGVTTRAVSARITEFSESEGTATVIVSTQRDEVSGASPEHRVYYQDIRLTLRRVGGVWLVDSAEWR